MKQAWSSTASTPPNGRPRAAAEIGRDQLPKGEAREVTVELRNAHRQRVLTVTVSMEMNRVDPEPVPPVRR